MNKVTKLFYAIALIAIAIACTDPIEDNPNRLPGYLYFNVSEGHVWSDGNATRGGAEAPILLSNSLDGGQPLYLHTEVTPSTPEIIDGNEAATRGIRYTGDVFTPSTTSSTLTKITSFGVYATTTGGASTIFNFKEITPTFGTETASGTTYDSYQWNTKEEDIGNAWSTGTADFYGYAPYFNNSSNSNGLSMTATGGVPKLTYTMPSDAANQLDLLTAKKIGVNKGQDVELEFSHIMAAIKFNFKHGSTVTNSSGTITTADKNSFIWNDGISNYDVKVTKIEIKNIYNTGEWQLGDDPYTATSSSNQRWVRNSNTTASCKYELAKDMKYESTSPVELTPDEGGNVFMVLPQTVPNDATIELTCQLFPSGTTTATKTMTLSAALKETDGTTNKTWLPGYTYTYTISLSDFAYVFDFNTETSFVANDVPTTGKNFDRANNTSGNGFVVRSYKIDSKGNKIAVNWKLQHKVPVSSVTGSTTSYQADDEVWEDGSNGWMHLIDNDGAGTEVTGTHVGAYQSSDATNWYYRLQIGSIMTPVIDLSLYNYDQTKRWNRSTANCYIVAGPGTYRIPLVYGNTITNGSLVASAWNPGNTGTYALSTFRKYNDEAISSPFIKTDVGSGTYTACLVWEEGDGTGTTSAGASGSTAATTGDDAKYGHQYNIGRVVKVIEAIDTYNEAADGYNTTTGSYVAGADYIQFEISPDNFNYGNAVIGLRFGNTIVWSWHIWITDPSTFTTNQTIALEDGHSVTLAGRNIGWVDGGQSKNVEKRNGYLKLVQAETDDEIFINANQIKRNAFISYFTNVLYQFGRKDPMRGNVDPNQDNTVNGAPRGTAGIVAWNTNYRLTGNEKTIGYLIQHPNEICASNGDLYPSSLIPSSNRSYCNIWAANQSETYQSMWGTWQVLGKTIYDPSPVGYIVPPSRYLVSLAGNGYRSAFAEKTRDDTPPIICDFTHSGDHAKFYASGIRTTTNGRDLKSMGFRVPGPALLFRGALGHYHTSTPYSRDENYQLHLNFYGGDAIGDADEIDTHVKMLGDHAEALSVMPMVYNFEQNMTEVEEPREDPQRNTDSEVYPYQTLSRGNNSKW